MKELRVCSGATGRGSHKAKWDPSAVMGRRSTVLGWRQSCRGVVLGPPRQSDQGWTSQTRCRQGVLHAREALRPRPEWRDVHMPEMRSTRSPLKEEFWDGGSSCLWTWNSLESSLWPLLGEHCLWLLPWHSPDLNEGKNHFSAHWTEKIQKAKAWLVRLNPASASVHPFPGVLSGKSPLKVCRYSPLYHQMAPLS